MRFFMKTSSDITRMLHKFAARVAERVGILNKTKREYKAVSSSPLFDKTWYLETYPDVRRSKMDPLVHYLKYGHLEGRDPGPEFSTKTYYFLHEDVKKAGQNALVHYERHGRTEGRIICSAEEGTRVLSTESSRQMLTSGRRFQKGLTKQHARDKRKEAVTGGVIPASFPLARKRSNRWDIQSVFCQTENLPQIELGGELLGTIGEVSGAGPDGFRNPLIAFCRLMGLDASRVIRFRGTNDGDEAWNLEEPSAGNAGDFLLPGFAGKAGMEIADLWYATDMDLRLRLESGAGANDPASAPMIRLFQADPLDLQRLVLLSEKAIVESGPVVLDVPLANPFFPVLVCVNSSSGALLSLSLLPFPSLCRGGAHYGELLATCEARSDLENLAFLSGRFLADRLDHPGANRALDEVRVRTADALGSERIFRPDIRLWMAVCFNLPIMPDEAPAATAGTGQTELARSLIEWPKTYASLPLEFRAKGSSGAGGRLRLSPDCIPSLSAMVAGDSLEGLSGRPAMLVVADATTAVPAWSVTRTPAGPGLESGSQTDSNFPSVGPRETDAGGTGSAAPTQEEEAVCLAVRFANLSHPDETRLLMPYSPETRLPAEPAQTRPRLSVFIAGSGRENTMQAALQAVFLQAGVDLCDVVLSVAEEDDKARQAATALCDGETPVPARVALRPGATGIGGALTSAIPDMSGDYVLVMSDAVVLHDPRTLSLLSGAVSASDVASASCMLVEQVKVEKKVERLDVRSYGYFLDQPPAGRATPLTVWAPDCQGVFIRESYPVFASHGDLFLTKKTTLVRPEAGLSASDDLLDVALKIGCLAYGEGLRQVGTSLVSAGVTKGVLPPVDRAPFEIPPGALPPEDRRFHPNETVIRMLDT